MPPPAVHILDHATFSNITEQFRSVYRDTAASPINYFEGVLETQVRGAVRPGASEPDFGDEVYAEFLLDDVLRGDFESRQAAYKDADYMTIAEKRAKENLPFIEGTDRIVINAASIPLDMLDEVTAARSAKSEATPAASTVRTLMGRLGWQQSLDDIDPAALTAGLNGEAQTVLALLEKSKAAGEDVTAFKHRHSRIGERVNKHQAYRFRGQVPPEKREPIRAELTAKSDGNTATIRLYDVIDSWGDARGASPRRSSPPSSTSSART
jgi:hypothetical protein